MCPKKFERINRKELMHDPILKKFIERWEYEGGQLAPCTNGHDATIMNPESALKFYNERRDPRSRRAKRMTMLRPGVNHRGVCNLAA
jgi:hypothetical protein